MKTVSATRAARNFASPLDEIEHGETVIITRDGRPVGRLQPETQTVAQSLADALRECPADPEFASDLLTVHEDLATLFSSEVREWQHE